MTHSSLRTALAAGLMIVASTGMAPAAGPSASPQFHCVQQVSVDATPPPPATCFDTYAGAIGYLTGGRVQLSPTLASEPAGGGDDSLDMQIAAGEVANTVYVISTEYTGTGWTGSTYTFTWSATCAGLNIAWSTMPSGFNDTISSSHTGTSCTAIHYDNAGATPSTPPSGASISCPTYSSCSTLGTMNDKTSSMRWVP